MTMRGHESRLGSTGDPPAMRTSIATSILSCTLLIGCASSGPRGLPGGAVLIGEGADKVAVTAADKGTLYVRDARADRVVYVGSIDKGQRVELDARSNRLTIDGRPVDTH